MWWGVCMCRLPTPGRLLLLLPDRVLLLLPDRVLLLLPDRVLLLVLCALVAPSAASGGRASDGERHCAGIWSDDVIYEVRQAPGCWPPPPKTGLKMRCWWRVRSHQNEPNIGQKMCCGTHIHTDCPPVGAWRGYLGLLTARGPRRGKTLPKAPKVLLPPFS